MKQPRNTVLTGVKALYLQGLISFNPDVYDFVFKTGASLSYYREKFPNMVPSTMIDEYRNQFVEEIDGYKLYTKERLFVEIDTFLMDSRLKDEAIRNLSREVNYSEVKKVVKHLSRKARFIPSESSVKYLDDLNINFLGEEVTKDQLEQRIREYILSKMFNHGIVYVAKGGAVIESYGHFKRGTKDNDAYLPINMHKSLVSLLQEPEHNIRFEVHDFNEQDFNNVAEMKRARMALVPISTNPKLARLIKGLTFQMDVDYSISERELNAIIKNYKIKPRNLWKSQNKYTPITLDMSIAEKIQSSLDSIKKKRWRARDMIDIFKIMKQMNDIEKVRSWLMFKIKRSPKGYTLQNYKEFLKEIKDDSDKYKKECVGSAATYGVKDFSFNDTFGFIETVLKGV